MYKYPIFAVYLFAVLSAYFVGIGNYTKAWVSAIFGFIYYFICDIIRGDHIGWWRKERTKKIKSTR